MNNNKKSDRVINLTTIVSIDDSSVIRGTKKWTQMN